MSEILQLQKKQNRTLIVVSINFVMFVILFSAMGYVTWQSASLVKQLKGNLDQAEQTIAQLKEHFEQMDKDEVVDRLITAASKQVGESVKQVVQDIDFTTPLSEMSEKLSATQETFERTNQAIVGIHDTVKGLDNEEISKLVSYHLLKDLGDGLHKAAERNKPGSME